MLFALRPHCDHSGPVSSSSLTFPKGGNVRLVQMGVSLRHLNHVISEVAPDAPLVFCGDFNSCPDSGNSTCHGILKQIHPPSRRTSQMDVDVCCCRQVCSSWPLKLRSLSSTQTGAAQGQRSLATRSFFLHSPHWWAPATDQVTPTMWGDFTAAWTTSSYSQSACRFGYWQF